MGRVFLSIFTAVIPLIFKALGPDHLKGAMDTFLDYVEDKAQDSTTTVDDALVLPLCKMIRDAFSIPDDD